jgi:hypothetical protein
VRVSRARRRSPATGRRQPDDFFVDRPIRTPAVKVPRRAGYPSASCPPAEEVSDADLALERLHLPRDAEDRQFGDLSFSVLVIVW